MSNRTRNALRTNKDSDSDDDEFLAYSPTQLSELPSPRESTNSESNAAPGLPVLLDSDVQTMSNEPSDQEPTVVEHSGLFQNNLEPSHVSFPAEPGPEQESEQEQGAELEQNLEPGRPQRVHRPPRMFTYNTLGHPTISSVQTCPNLVPGWHYPPFQSTWISYVCISTFHHPLMVLRCTRRICR